MRCVPPSSYVCDSSIDFKLSDYAIILLAPTSKFHVVSFFLTNKKL